MDESDNLFRIHKGSKNSTEEEIRDKVAIDRLLKDPIRTAMLELSLCCSNISRDVGSPMLISLLMYDVVRIAIHAAGDEVDMDVVGKTLHRGLELALKRFNT